MAVTKYYWDELSDNVLMEADEKYLSIVDKPPAGFLLLERLNMDFVARPIGFGI